MTQIYPQCMPCKHLVLKRPIDGNPRCSAYPDGIPIEILMNEVDHRQPYKGDNGIQFEARPGERYPYPDGVRPSPNDLSGLVDP